VALSADRAGKETTRINRKFRTRTCAARVMPRSVCKESRKSILGANINAQKLKRVFIANYQAREENSRIIIAAVYARRLYLLVENIGFFIRAFFHISFPFFFFFFFFFFFSHVNQQRVQQSLR